MANCVPLALLFVVAPLAMLGMACTDKSQTAVASARTDGSTRNSDSIERGSNEEANYEALFPTDKVIRLDVQIAATEWSKVIEDMTEIAGPFGGGATTGSIGGTPMPAALDLAALAAPCAGRTEGDVCTNGGAKTSLAHCTRLPVAPQLLCTSGAEGPVAQTRTPVFVAAKVTVAGRSYNHVGFRLKGNSSLHTAWERGIYKLPIRLDADELRDRHPEVAKQRILGFKSLSLTPGIFDPSLCREKVTADILRAAGVPAPRTAFARVFVDRGEGLQYFGLYALAEVPGKPLLQAQFGDDAGNLYKPEGAGARLGMFEQSSFEKKTNKTAADFGDVQRTIAALNADRTDAAAWRAGLEATFDVPGFLRWLAINTIVGNWDTYGQMPQNYYLYGNPRNGGRLAWIAWDLDSSFSDRITVTPMHERVDASWPLIRHLLDDPSYRTQYVAALKEAMNGVTSVVAVRARFETAQQLIRPYVIGDQGERPGYSFLVTSQAFDGALDDADGILTFLQRRAAEIGLLTP